MTKREVEQQLGMKFPDLPEEALITKIDTATSRDDVPYIELTYVGGIVRYQIGHTRIEIEYLTPPNSQG